MSDVSPTEPLSAEPVAEGGATLDLVQRLRARVAQRRAAGEYPEGLEDRLEAHFRRIVFHRHDAEVDQLQADVDAIDSHMDFSTPDVSFDSRVPGGAALHRAISQSMERHNQQVAEHMQGFANTMRRALRTIATTVRDPRSHVHGDVIGHVDAVLERLDSYERAPVDAGAALGDLRRRVEQLERAEATRGFRPWFTNDAFENRFRGSRDELRAQYRDLAEMVALLPPMLDLGCGRGEFVELVNEMGGDARGIELDEQLVAAARAAGIAVDHGDAIAALAAADDESIGAITLLQVIEHLTIQQQLDVVALAYEKLRPGGRVIIETVNPQSLYVFAHSFYTDPTHTRPVHPAYLSFLFEEAGFSNVAWHWRNEPPVEDRLEPEGEGGLDTAADRNVERLNRLLFAPGDYALVIDK